MLGHVVFAPVPYMVAIFGEVDEPMSRHKNAVASHCLPWALLLGLCLTSPDKRVRVFTVSGIL